MLTSCVSGKDMVKKFKQALRAGKAVQGEVQLALNSAGVNNKEREGPLARPDMARVPSRLPGAP